MTTQRTRTWYVVALVALMVANGSCLFDTETHLCDSGRRCKQGQVCAVAQDVCIDIGGCGDGVVSGGREVCDDGNIRDGDGCSADCTSDETCGNDVIDMTVGENCDDGNLRTGDGCSAICQLESCGNSSIDVVNGSVLDGNGEQREVNMEVCDDGNAESGDGCSADCLSNEVCGNDVLDQFVDSSTMEPVLDDQGNPVLYEECDPGEPGLHTAVCNADCTVPLCGDGVFNLEHDVTLAELEPFGIVECPEDVPACPYPEQCDTAGDSETCDADCTIPICGDGHPNTAVEECDPGMLGLSTAECNANCTWSECPDGFWNPVAGEDCDEGGNTEECDSDCTPPACGDNHYNPQYVNPATGKPEECDGGSDSDGNPKDTAYCDYDCTEPECGDNHVNSQFINPDTGEPEECDEGGINTEDCDSVCTFPSCGDGHRNPEFTNPNTGEKEQCDEGGDTASCDVDCTTPRCGDNHHNPQYVNPDTGTAEECDDGGVNTTMCDRDCTAIGCPDGIVNEAVGEVCDTDADCDPTGTLNLCCTGDCKSCVACP